MVEEEEVRNGGPRTKEEGRPRNVSGKGRERDGSIKGKLEV